MLRCNIGVVPVRPGPQGFVCGDAAKWVALHGMLHCTKSLHYFDHEGSIMSSKPAFSANLLLAPWLGAAEIARQQATMLTEFNRQALRFWTGGLVRAAAAPAPAEEPTASVVAAEPAPLPAPTAEPEATPVIEAASEPVTEATPEPATKPARVRAAKAAAQTLRTAPQRRKTAKRSSRITRH